MIKSFQHQTDRFEDIDKIFRSCRWIFFLDAGCVVNRDFCFPFRFFVCSVEVVGGCSAEIINAEVNTGKINSEVGYAGGSVAEMVEVESGADLYPLADECSEL